MNEEIKKFISISSWLVALQIVSLVVFVSVAGFLYLDVQSVKQELRASNAGSSPAPANVKNWQELIRPYNASLGAEGAPIVVMEFTDFQCPYCRNFHDSTRDQLLSKYGDKIRFVFKHFPLEQIHEHAKLAAIAAQCAEREGKFWQTEDILFKNQENLSTEAVMASGRALGLSLSFEKCVQNQATIAEVDQDIRDGLSVGVRGTPTFLINGKMISGAMPLDRWESLISGAH